MTESPAPIPGPLLLAGGAEFDGRMASADRIWLRLLGHPMPRLGLIPTANTERPKVAASNGARHFKGLLTQAEPVMVTNVASANDPSIVAQVGALDAAYFAGGNPVYLAQTLRNSAVWEALARRWRDGMALGGSSAGAMVLCAELFVQDRWEAALGLVSGVVTLPHFDRRDAPSAERARLEITGRGLTGLGIDESTAAVWHRGDWLAAGRGRVVILSGEGASVFIAGEKIVGLPQPG
jgi:cyanophycinase